MSIKNTQKENPLSAFNILLALGVTASLAGNAYQGYSYSPTETLTLTMAFMILIHLLLDMGKFLSLKATFQFQETQQTFKFYTTLIIFIFTSAISMFSIGNLITSLVKKDIQQDQQLIQQLTTQKTNLLTKITEGNTNPFIQNCKWALSKKNKNYGTATKAFCNKFNSKGKVQENSRPIMLDQVTQITKQINQLENKEYFSMVTYLNETTTISKTTLVNILIAISTVTVELLISVTPYLFKTPLNKTPAPTAKIRKVAPKRKVASKAKAKPRTKVKTTPKVLTTSLTIAKPETYTFKTKDEISPAKWKKYHKLYRQEKASKIKKVDRLYRQVDIAQKLQTQQGTVSKMFKELNKNTKPRTTTQKQKEAFTSNLLKIKQPETV